MELRFTALASGSGGNASLVEAGGAGVLLDLGLGPRPLAERLGGPLEWRRVHAALLTHTHSDHWKEATLAQLRRRRLPLYCHAGHHRVLGASSAAFAGLAADGLVRPFEAGQELELAPGLRVRPLPIRHDASPTFAFRFEGPPDLFGRAAALGYAADLGCWDDDLATAFADVDLLAVEFNHDVTLEKDSGRGERLIARVLGDEGHLSNEQAAGLVRAVLGRSAAGRLKHLVQLHLSRECNVPNLARQAARGVLAGEATRVHTAEQHAAGPTLRLLPEGPRRRAAAPRRRAAPVAEPWLPGLEGAAAG